MLGVYTVQEPHGNNKEGDRIEMDCEKAEPLVSAGLLKEADEMEDEKDEDVTDVEDEKPEVEAAMQRAIKRIEKQAAEAVQAAIKKAAPGVNVKVPAQVVQPTFKNLGDACRALWQAKRNGNTNALRKVQEHNKSVRQKAPLGMNEGTAAQGGLLIVPEWYEKIWDKQRDYPRLKDKCDVRTLGNTNTFNIEAVSETSLQDGNRHGGVLSYWQTEGNTVSSTYPQTAQIQSVLNTRIGLGYVTNQLLQDAYYDVDAHLSTMFAKEFVFQENNDIIAGTGSSQPKGILNQASYVTVAKEGGQTAGTVVLPNLAKAFGRLWAASQDRAILLVNPEVLQQLILLTFPNAAGSFPANGLTYDVREKPKWSYLGCPVVPWYTCSQLGLSGDVIFADLSQLVFAESMADIEIDISTELKFDSYQTAFRWVRRYDVQCPWTAALTPYDGSANSFSPFCGIASRGT